MQKLIAASKPKKCPKCGDSPVASILYGLPAMDEALDERIEGGSVVLGGCIVSDDDAEWQCNSCGTQIYRQK